MNFNGKVYYTGARNQTLIKSFSAYHFCEGLMRNIGDDINEYYPLTR